MRLNYLCTLDSLHWLWSCNWWSTVSSIDLSCSFPGTCTGPLNSILVSLFHSSAIAGATIEPRSAKNALSHSKLNLMFIFLSSRSLIKARWRLTHRCHLLRRHLDGLRPDAGTLLKWVDLEDYRKPAADET